MVEENKNDIVKQYIEGLSEIERVTMEIAQKNLKTSFDIEKSLGFIEWLKNNS